MAIQMGRGVSLILLIAVSMMGTATAQSSDDCTNVIISMSPCLNYITGNSSFPSAGCCTQLKTVVQNKPQCLCQVLNGGGSNLGLNINQTQALALPGACKVQTPPTSSCSIGSPSGSPTGTSGSPNTGSGGGSNSTPSGATSKKLAAPLVFFIPLVAYYVSTLFISY